MARVNGNSSELFDVTSGRITVNPDDSNLTLTSLGYSSATDYSVSELSAEHDGQMVFAGRPDYSGNLADFPFVCFKSGHTFVNPTAVKIYVDRDVPVTYSGPTTIAADNPNQIPNPSNPVYVATVDIYEGEIYAGTFTENVQFQENDFRDYPVTFNYTDPDTGRGGSVNVTFKYAETSAQLFKLTTDRFPVYTAEKQATNQHPSGTLSLEFTTTPTIDSAINAYSTTTRDAIFNGIEAQLRGPSSSVGNLAYCDSTKLFKPQESWAATEFVVGSTNDFVVMGRVSDNNAESTYILHNGTTGFFDVYMGGVVQSNVAPIIVGRGNSIAWKNWDNSTQYVDTLYINGSTIYTSRTANRGTAVANVLATFGGGWNVAANVTPDTDAQRLSNGAISAIAINEKDNATVAALTEEDFDGIYLRNDKRFLVNLTGDSIADGATLVDPTTESFYALCRADSIERGHDAEWTETAISGRTTHQGSAVAHEGDFQDNPPWVVGSRPTPSPAQSADAIWGSKRADLVIGSYTGGNGTAANFVDKNPNPGIPGSAGLGFNSYADEDIYEISDAIAYFEARGVTYIHSNPTPRMEATIVGVDNLTVQDAQKVMRDVYVNNTPFKYQIDSWDDMAEPDNTFKPGIANDAVHWDAAGHQVHRPNVNSEVNKVLDANLEFIPEILTLDGEDVTGGQIPKINTASGGTIAVSWRDNKGQIINDTEPVSIDHINATLVEVNRQGTIVEYSHKTGLPIPLLKSYYEDGGSPEVDFNGTYVVPDTVTSPVQFGWSVSNGNETGSVLQTPFTQAMIVDQNNDVIMPVFTDDWGNSATIASRTVSVLYGEDPIPTFTYNTPTQVGNALAIDADNVMDICTNGPDRIAFSRSDDSLKTYDFDGTDWSNVGTNGTTVSSGTIRSLSDTTVDGNIVYIDSDDVLQGYVFNGSTWETVGSQGAITTSWCAICKLSATRYVVATKDTSHELSVWDFSGTTWTQVGNTFDTGTTAGNLPSVGYMSDSTFSYCDAGTGSIRMYSFDGENITQVGNALSLGTVSNPSLARLNAYDVALANFNTLNVYRFDGTNWSDVGTEYNIPSSGNARICTLDSLNIAMVTQFGAVLNKLNFTTTP